MAKSKTPKIKPLKKLLFIKCEVEEQRGSIVLARMSKQMPDRGTVIAISDRAEKELEIVKVGTRVLYDKHYQKYDEYENTSQVNAEHVLAVLT